MNAPFPKTRRLFLTLSLSVMFAIVLTGGVRFKLGGPLHGTVDLTSFELFAALSALLLWASPDVPARLERTLSALVRRPIATFLIMVGLLSVAHLFRHWSFHTHAFDQLTFHQPLFQPYRCDICPGGSVLGYHLSFSSALLTAVQWPWTLPALRAWSDEWTFVVQGVWIAATTLLAVRTFSAARASGPFLFLALLPLMASRAFRAGALWDLREDTLAYGFLILALALWRRKREAAAAALLAVTLLSKENFGPVVAFFALGTMILARKEGRSLRWPAVVLIGSIAYTTVAFKWIIPRFSVASSSDIVTRLGEFGSTPEQILTNLLFNPLNWWRVVSERLFTLERLRYVLFLTAPFAFFWRHSSLPWAFAGLAGLAMNLISNALTQRSLQFHYDWIILPFWAFGAWVGLENTPAGTRTSSRRVAFLFCACLAFGGRSPIHFLREHWPGPLQLRKVLALKGGRPFASVTGTLLTTGPLAPHVVPHASTFQIRFADAHSPAEWDAQVQALPLGVPRTLLVDWDQLSAPEASWLADQGRFREISRVENLVTLAVR